MFFMFRAAATWLKIIPYSITEKKPYLELSKPCSDPELMTYASFSNEIQDSKAKMMKRNSSCFKVENSYTALYQSDKHLLSYWNQSTRRGTARN